MAKKKRKKKKAIKEEPASDKRPMHPRLVLLIAMLLPGYGHLINRQPKRAFVFSFTLTGAWITYNLTTPEHSFLGRFAGGVFVYAIGFFDAYKWARYRYEFFKIHKALPTDLRG